MMQQLPLALHWPRQRGFDGIHTGDNAATLASVEQAVRGQEASMWPFLVGSAGSGKSHILMAACRLARQIGRRAQYLGLRQLGAQAVDALEACGGADVVAVDDVALMIGNAAGERALFALYNRGRQDGVTMLFAARRTPAQMAPDLPDLQSRLAMCTLLPVRILDEDGRRDVLRERAAARGIELDDAVLNWLFTHHARDLVTLLAVLDRVDTLSLARKRRITIPLLRELLGTSSSLPTGEQA